MLAVLYACVSAAAFGGLSVAIRMALRASPNAELGSLVTSGVAFAVTVAIAAASVPSRAELRPDELWPFVLAGALAPGLSQLFFFQAVRDVGASRASVIVGTAPLVSFAIALLALGEPLRWPLVGGAVLIVAGSVALGLERVRPEGFSRIGVGLAFACTAMFSTRDNLLRWLSTGTTVAPLTAAAVAMGGGAATLLGYLVARGAVTRDALRASARSFVAPGLLFGASYATLFAAYYRGRVTVVSPLVATESLWGVVFALLLLRHSERIGRHVVLGAFLVVAGGALIGAAR